MRSKVFLIASVLVLVAMALAPLAPVQAARTAAFGPKPERTPTQLPDEILELFKDGMTVDEFLALNEGQPIPRALERLTDKAQVMIIELEKPALAKVLGEQGGVDSMNAATQASYVQALLSEQAPVASAIEAAGGKVWYQMARVYNGILARIPANQLDTIRQTPGVKAVHYAATHTVELTESVPLTQADVLWELPYELTGEGMRIAVIDTGIDYTHATFGGAGTPAAYTGNNPNIVEPGTFPTAKVIDGYDFAGTAYNANLGNDPEPDDDPLDEGGHGTHVASIAAGMGVMDGSDYVIGPGTAPGASLIALKVFGAAGSTNLVTPALEWAIDPNGDGSLDDRVDVINMSLGSTFFPNDTNDPEIIAVNNAGMVGVSVVTSAGNSGNSPYVNGGPSAADYSLSTASTTTGYAYGPAVNVTTGTNQPKVIYDISAFDAGGHFLAPVTAQIADVDLLDGAGIGELCTTTGLASDALLGKIALIQRGTCNFTTKVNNAGSLGAVAALIYNNAANGDNHLRMVGTAVTIPAGFLIRTYGLLIKAEDGQTATISAESEVEKVADVIPARVISTFSSRGPRGFDSALKPEIAAPGTQIFAAAMGSGAEGVAFNGTSMASPHVAGIAALVRQAHPNWSPEMVKAALMNTADDLNWGLNPVNVALQGAGMVDALGAVTTPLVAIGDPVLISLNWGVQQIDTLFSSTKMVTVYNVSPASIDVLAIPAFTSSSTGAAITAPATPVMVPAGGSVQIPITLTLDPTMLTDEYGGYLEDMFGFVNIVTVITGAAPEASAAARVPFYVIPQPFTKISLDTAYGEVMDDYWSWDLQQSGPIPSDLWGYSVFATDTNEPVQNDMADLRYVGMDYGWYSSTYGDIFIPAFNYYGGWHTLQPYWSETDLWLDVDRDGAYDLANFNYNLGWYNGSSGSDLNTWLVIQVDYVMGGMIFLGSPYAIWSDYHSGFQEWYLPAVYNYLGDVDGNPATPEVTQFDFQAMSFDWEGDRDVTEPGRFDYLNPPLVWEAEYVDPFNELFWLDVAVYFPENVIGTMFSRPKGFMLVDYMGKAGMGEAYFFPFNPDNFFQVTFPFVNANP